jgi:hypothetical protein
LEREVCRRHLTGESVPSPTPIITNDAYSLMVNCECGASHAFVMMLSEYEASLRDWEEYRYREHMAALDALTQARRSGAPWSVLRRLEAREEQLAYAE